MDAGFLSVVENGQYFMTKDTAEFSQFTDAVACREYTLPREEEASQPKGWIQGVERQQVQREEDGAVHFWRIKEHLQSQFAQIPYWSDDRWKACLAAGGGAKRRFQYCTDASGTIVYFRALQGHSGRNLIDP